jgi:hypothetical protein
MNKYIPSIALIICAFSAVAQNNNSNNIPVRNDTKVLKAAECEWIFKPLIKNNPVSTSETRKPVPLIIMEAIEKAKLKAIDPATNKPIPAKEIFTWKMAVDTLPAYDDTGNVIKYLVVKRQHSINDLNQIRICQDWYLEEATGKFHTVIKWIELLEEIHSGATGTFIGYSVYCRIYY